MREELWLELDPKKGAALINKYLGRYVWMDPSGKILVYGEEGIFEEPVKVEKPEDLDTLLNVIASLCTVERSYDSGHPLGRGWIVFNCGKKKIRIEIHGDWWGGTDYVKIRKEIR